MATPWAHLPNAALIDEVMATLAALPPAHQRRIGDTDRGKTRASWSATWGHAQAIGRAATWTDTIAAGRMVYDTPNVTPWDNVCCALVVWDQAGVYYTMPLPALRMALRIGALPVPDCYAAELILAWREIIEPIEGEQS